MRRIALMAGFVTLALSGVVHADDPSILAPEWDAYKAAFVTDDGRVVDNANGGISHSESQGYGMLLSILAQDQDSFASIWGFTEKELMVRKDGLAAWKWDPEAMPHVTDLNNATDGDILLAYSLGLASAAWKNEAYRNAGRNLATAIGQEATMSWHGRHVLLPGAFGFGQHDQDDGPVVNPSYWIFEAFPMLAELAPATDWPGIDRDGRRLIAEAKFGKSGLPSDWISLAGPAPVPAANFPAEFGYNSVRIPLYLLRGGSTQEVLLGQFIAPLDAGGEPGTRLVASDQLLDPLTEPGYQIIGAAVDCVVSGKLVPKALLQFQPQSYYGSTLHLLTLSFLRENARGCL